MREDVEVGQVRTIPYGPSFQVLEINNNEVLVDFFESGKVCYITIDEALKCPIKD